MTTRSCAQQDYSYQMFRSGHGWTTVTRIEEEAYSEGCFTAVGSDDLRRHRTTYCFCSGDLCNAGGPDFLEAGDGHGYGRVGGGGTDGRNGAVTKVVSEQLRICWWCLVLLASFYYH